MALQQNHKALYNAQGVSKKSRPHGRLFPRIVFLKPGEDGAYYYPYTLIRRNRTAPAKMPDPNNARVPGSGAVTFSRNELLNPVMSELPVVIVSVTVRNV